MERRDFYENKGTDGLTCASTFYGLEALKTAVMYGNMRKYDGFLKSNRMLYEDIVEYQNALMDKLAPMLFDYSVVACYGELRHIASTSHAKYKGAGLPTRTQNRNDAYVKALAYNPIQILELCVEAFDKSNHWDGAFGGEKWQNIAKHALRYGKIDKLIFCDTAFSLSHNCSPFLNKIESRIFYISSTSRYKELLDTKFAKSPNETIWYILGNLSEFDRRFLSLIERAYNLGFIYLNNTWRSGITYSTKLNLIDVIDKRYRPLHYECKKMSPKKMHVWCNSLKEQKFYDQLKIGMNVMFEKMDKNVCYRPSAEKKKNSAVYKSLFKYDHQYFLAHQIFEKIPNIKNQFDNFVIKDLMCGQVTLACANGDTCTVDFRGLIGLDEKCKTVRVK